MNQLHQDLIGLKMKKLHKEAMKLQGGDRVIKMVREQGES